MLTKFDLTAKFSQCFSCFQKRAVKAENSGSRLQAEVKSLQSRLASVQAENDVLRSGDHGLSDIRQRTTHVSQQLTTAATAAELNLKQLLQGVENLRLFSQILSSVDKITEPPLEEETGNQSQQSENSQSEQSKSSQSEQNKNSQSQRSKSSQSEQSKNSQSQKSKSKLSEDHAQKDSEKTTEGDT